MMEHGFSLIIGMMGGHDGCRAFGCGSIEQKTIAKLPGCFFDPDPGFGSVSGSIRVTSDAGDLQIAAEGFNKFTFFRGFGAQSVMKNSSRYRLPEFMKLIKQKNGIDPARNTCKEPVIRSDPADAV